MSSVKDDVTTFHSYYCICSFSWAKLRPDITNTPSSFMLSPLLSPSLYLPSFLLKCTFMPDFLNSITCSSTEGVILLNKSQQEGNVGRKHFLYEELYSSTCARHTDEMFVQI